MKIIYKFVEYQPYMVGAVAIAYLGGAIIAKTLCKEGEAVSFNNFKCFSSADVCHAPGEVTIPLAFVSGTSATLTQSAISFTPHFAEDAEIAFQLV